MLSRRQKQVFYDVMGPVLALNGLRHRYLSSVKKDVDGKVKVHLGPEQRNYINGWTNIDANAFTGKCDIWADLRNALPLADSTVDALYSHHVIEHLPYLKNHFAEAYRVLKPGGVYRVGGPNGDVAIRKFVEEDHSWFGDWPDKYSSIGGRFENFIFCRNEHLTILTYSFLNELAVSVGFQAGVKMLPRSSTGHKEIFDVCLAKEREEDPASPRTLIIEFTKN